MQLTTEQTSVVKAPVSDLLVSAAAGSGKTAVMTQRIVQRIASGDLDVQSVLVMTFTEAAARQMKEKIAAKLETARLVHPDLEKRRALGRQQTMLASASISTIHAFCLTVIRNFSHLAVDASGQLQIEPGFTVPDPQMADLLLRETMDDVMASRYEAIDLCPDKQEPAWAAAFYRLVDSYSTSRSDEPLRQQVSKFYQYLRSLPDYRAKVTRYREDLADAAANFAASRHAQVLIAQLRILLGQATEALPELRELLAQGVSLIKDPARNELYHAQSSRIDETLCLVAQKLTEPDPSWDDLVDLATALDHLDLPRAGGKDPGKARALQILREQLAESIHCLSGQCKSETYKQHFLFETRCLFNRKSDQIEQEISAMLPAIGQLFDLVLELDERYLERKREQRLVDFADFEHLALAILQQPEAASYYHEHFREIYIDEYQDTSSIQEAILKAIARDNVFMVGDVKQSIYRFRHAQPGIFIHRFEQYLRDGSGRLRTLNCNFRSVPGVLEAVNEVFAQLMSPEAGEIDYTQGHGLVPFRTDESKEPAVELCLIQQVMDREDQEELAADDSDSQTWEELDEETRATDADATALQTELDPAELSLYEREARVISKQIVHLLQIGKHQPRDIVILARSRAIVRLYAAALREQAIATLEDTGRMWFDNPDLRLIHALLLLMDNPCQDIPLAAVLRAGLLERSFLPSELLAIRIFAQQQESPCRFFYEAVSLYAREGSAPTIREPLKRFLAELECWRDREKFRKTGEWLEWLLESTGFYSQVASLDLDQGRLREVRGFVAWVHQFEASRARGLFDLVRHIENLERNGLNQAPYDLAAIEQNAVRVMTIHSSKGLEFPLVYVVGLSARITPKEQQDILLVSETLGIGFDFVDPEGHLRRTTHLKLAMLAEHKAATLSEEMRLLYVAMTRARDRLVLVSMLSKNSQKALASRMAKARAWPNPVLPPHLVLSGRSYLDWLILALARHPDLDWSRLTDLDLERDQVLSQPTAGVWSLQIESLGDYLGSSAKSEREKEMVEAESKAQPGPDQQEMAQPVPAKPWILSEHIQIGLDELIAGSAATAELDLEPIVLTYPYASAAKSPVKLSVSELKRREQEESRFEEDQSLPLVDQTDALGINLDLKDLKELAEPDSAPVKGARLGTALHMFLRYLDLPEARREPGLHELKRQLDSLTAQKILSSEEALALANWLEAILEFVQSDLAGRMAFAEKEHHQLYREMPFTLAVPATEVWPGEKAFAADDRALVQGMIDCWFREDNQAILVDYKSDRLSGPPEQIRQILNHRYGRQLDYYAQAITAGTGLSVRERLIVHLPSRQIFHSPGKGD